MVFSLALKNIKAKPLRTVATIAVIALSVAMFFCMFAFGDAVYDYIYAVETADAGNIRVHLVEALQVLPAIRHARFRGHYPGLVARV